jgi:hypothetical protein
MRKTLLIIAVAVLALLVLRELNKPAPAEKPSVFDKPVAARPPPAALARKPSPAPPLTPPPPSQLNKGKVIAAPPPDSFGGHPKPPPNSIPFQVVGGLVISYGDQLLGRPTVDDFPNEGFIEAPKVGVWPGGEIPYSFDPRFSNPERVQRVIAYFNQYTPVRFVPYTNQKDSIVFSPGEVPLCLSYVGRIGGHQPIYLDDRCFEKEITHELMHALGFIHEHSRPDRDQFVRVNWESIEEDKQSQFEAAPLSMASPQKGRPFDFQSVMIYNPTDFAKVRGDYTLESLTGAKIEPTPSGISPEDLARLVIMYER